MADKDKFAGEVMSNEELEQVAGGNFGQTSEDSKFLYDYGLMDDHYSSFEVTFCWNSKSAAVDAGWSKAGITCVTKPFFAYNLYFIGGKEISRDDAFKIVKEKLKKFTTSVIIIPI